MSLRARVARALSPSPSPGQRVNAALDGVRLTRPVAYTGSQTTPRVLADLALQSEGGFAGSALAYRCVQSIATNAASLDLVVERTRGDKTVPVPEHPVATLWNRRPNPLVSARAFKETVWAQLELAGESFVYLDRGETGEGAIQGVYVIFSPVEVVVDSRVAGTIKGYVVRVGGQRVPLLPSEVLWLRYPHPREPWGAMAPYRAAGFALDLDGMAKAWQLGELRNGARPEGVVYLGDVDPDTHDAIVADFTARHTGPASASRHLFVSGTEAGAYQRIGLTAQEVAYADTRKGNAEEVFLAFGVPRDYLMGGTTYENRRAARQTLWSDTIVPKLEVVAGDVDRQLLPDLTETCHFDVSKVDALRENEDAIYSRVQGAVKEDLLTLDEAREVLGLPPLPNGLGTATLSAYRAPFRGFLASNDRVNPAVLGSRDGAPPSAPLHLNHVHVAYQDALPAPQPDTHTRARVTDDTDQVLREYERLERIGLGAVRRLADKMERVVLQAAERKSGQALRGAVEAWDAAYQPAPDLTGEHRLADLADAVRQGVDDLFDSRFWIDQTEEALGDTVVAGAYDAGAARVGTSLGLSFDLYDQDVTAAMRARSTILAQQVVETTRLALADALLDPGVEAGESVPELADRLRQVFTDLRGYRAETIARTETVGGFNAASHIAAARSDVAVAREWMSASDDRVRDSHVALNGYRTQGMADAYPNGCLHPGDPMGPPEETVNCRCVEVYVLDDEE